MAVSLANLYSDQYTAVSGKRRNLPLAAIIHAQLPAHIAGGERERSEALDERALAETAKRHDTEMALRREELSEAGKQASRAQMIGVGQTGLGAAYVASKLGLIGGGGGGAAIPGAGITGTLTPAVTPGGAEALSMGIPSLAEVSGGIGAGVGAGGMTAGTGMWAGTGEMMGAEFAGVGAPSLAAEAAGLGGAATAGGAGGAGTAGAAAGGEVAGGAAGASTFGTYVAPPLIGLGIGYGVGKLTGSKAAGMTAGGAAMGGYLAAGTALGGSLGAVVGGAIGLVASLFGGDDDK